ncbi:MAG: hypothetical protein IPK03_15850 [Bacteroidetes bacterium]|nr:hypothetical protein [Bacteroidota bacterium]
MKEVAIYIFYLLGFGLFIYSSKFFQLSFISKKYVLGLFFATCGIAFFSIYAHIHIFPPASDIHSFHLDALIINLYLKKDLSQYLDLLLRSGGANIPNHLAEPIYSMGHWGNISNYFIVRIYALIIYLSSPNLYVISLFFGMMSFMGKFLMFKFFQQRIQSKANLIALLLLCFLIPNESFWTASMHKETLLLSVGIALYGLSKENLFGFITMTIGLMMMVYARDVYLWAFLIGLFVHYLINYTELRLRQIVLLAIVLILILLILPLHLDRSLLTILIKKKQEFALLKNANSSLEILHFLQAPIHAIYNTLLNGFIQPTIFKVRSMYDLVISIENLLGFFVLLLYIYMIPFKNSVKNAGIFLFHL